MEHAHVKPILDHKPVTAITLVAVVAVVLDVRRGAIAPDVQNLLAAILDTIKVVMRVMPVLV